MVSSLIRHLCVLIEMVTTINREKTKMNIAGIGLDIATRVFHVVCCNQQGHLVKRKMLKRAQVYEFIQNHQALLNGTETYGISHY